MTNIFIYNLDPKKDSELKMLCRKMNLSFRTVEKDEFSLTLESLLGFTDSETRREGADFDDEMLYIAGLQGGMLNLFLDQLRRKKLTVPLKAVMTQSNLSFTSYELHKELCAEREAIANGMKAH